MISYTKAEKSDAEILTRIQVSAFQDDVNICGSGPPGFDSIESQKHKIDMYHYYLILKDEKIIGGFYYNLEMHNCELIRIFIEPKFQNKGIGSEVLIFLESQSEINLIELEASDFNIKNQNFYKKRGYLKLKRKYYSEFSYSIVFQKKTCCKC